MSSERALKIQVNKIYGGWDFTYDGVYPTPRIKGQDKKNRNRYRRTLEKRDCRKTIQQTFKEEQA